MLETLVRWNGPPPGNQHFVKIVIPEDISYEVVDTTALRDWHLPDSQSARGFGHRWYARQRSAILIVPSVVARMDRNIIINAMHPEFRRLQPGPATPVWWDERLFNPGPIRPPAKH